MKSADQKRPLKVFLCHAHADRDPVRALYTRLTNDGVDAWLDKEKLLGGADWEYEIRNAVRESDVVVVCHSKQFNQKGFRQKEVKIALEEADLLPKGEIFIIPVRLEECDVLDDLKRWHWVDLFESDGYERLLRAFRVRADKIGATLQIKRSWLPKITSPLPKKQKLVEDKTTETSDKKILNNVDDMSPSPELPDGWEAQWQGAFVKNAKEATVKTTDTKVDRPSAKKTRKPNTTIIVSFIVLVMVSIFGLPSLFDTSIDDVPTPTQTKGEVALETQTVKPSLIPSIPTSTKTPSFTATPTPLLTEITDAKGVSMVLVPAGKFIMGSDEDVYYLDIDQQPAHEVFLDSFYIDQYEVTNNAYKMCVDAGVCSKPYNKSSNNRPLYYGNSEFNNYPVIYVDWYQAKSFCEWRGARLPTEAEWEKTARGTDGRSYPWADNVNGGANHTYSSVWTGDTTKVGSYPSGKSVYGAYDMAGNVWEWVNDWYKSDYYTTLVDNVVNPQGPPEGDSKVLRGGSWAPLRKAGGGGYIERSISAFNRHGFSKVA